MGAHFDELKACYVDALREHPRTAGRVAVRFELTPEGQVFKARVAEASLPDPKAQACLLDAFRRVAFDPPTDGHRRIFYPLEFSLN
jgi:TonB family protein